MGIQVLRRHRSLVVVLLALGASVLWLFRTADRAAAPDNAQTMQDGDLRVTLQLDQLTLGDRVVDITVRDAAGNAVPLTVLPTQSTIAPEPLPPLIFVRQGNLWRSDGSASPPRPITALNSGSYAEYPVLAPDGSQIAFVTTTQGPITETTQLPLPAPKTTLDLMRADGTSRHTIWAPARGALGVPAWASDGSALLVGYADILSAPDAPVPDRLFQIVQVDAATGARQVLLNDTRDPSISRDGKVLAYLHFDKAYYTFTVHVATPDGHGDREVVGPSAFGDLATPRLSPDSTQIVFAAQGGPPTDPQGFPIKAEHSSPLDPLLGLLAPATAEAHGSPWDLWIINSDGSGLRRIPMAREDSPMAVFSPDGRDIVMMGAGGIYRLHADGSNLRKIDPLGDHGGLDWASP